MEIPIDKEAMKDSCPQIILPGWWWKKWFASYRIFRARMQDLSDYEWLHGGYEAHIALMEEIFNMMKDQVNMSRFKTFFASPSTEMFEEIIMPGHVMKLKDDEK